MKASSFNMAIQNMSEFRVKPPFQATKHQLNDYTWKCPYPVAVWMCFMSGVFGRMLKKSIWHVIYMLWHESYIMTARISNYRNCVTGPPEGGFKGAHRFQSGRAVCPWWQFDPHSYPSVRRLVRQTQSFFFFFFLVLRCPLQKVQVALPG